MLPSVSMHLAAIGFPIMLKKEDSSDVFYDTLNCFIGKLVMRC